MQQVDPIIYDQDPNLTKKIEELANAVNLLKEYATKKYVDASLAAATLNLFLTDTASGIGDYYEMLFSETGAGGSSLTENSVSDGRTLLWSYISPQFALADQISAGLYIVSIWVEQDSNKTVTFTAKLYKRDSGGTETELVETSTSDTVTKDTKTQIVMSGFLESDTPISSTDRVVLKIYSNVSGGGGAPDITIYMEGTDDSRVAVRVPTSVITNKIFDADGDTSVTVEETADEDKIHFRTAGTKRLTIDENGKAVFNNVPENALDIAPDTDVYARIGRAYVGYCGSSDVAAFGHIDYRNTTNYGFVQESDGTIRVNAVAGKSVYLQVNGVNRVRVAGANAAALYLVPDNGYDSQIFFQGQVKTWRLFNDYSDSYNFKWRNEYAEAVRMYLTTGGSLYIDGSYNTFTPSLPKVQDQGWIEEIKKEAFKPHKPSSLKIDDMTEADIVKYGKDISKVALMNARAIEYLGRTLNYIQEEIDDLRQKRAEGTTS